MIAPEASLVMPTGGRGGFAAATAYHAFWAAGLVNHLYAAAVIYSRLDAALPRRSMLRPIRRKESS